MVMPSCCYFIVSHRFGIQIPSHQQATFSSPSMAATISLSFPWDPQSLHCPCRLNPTNFHKPHQTPFFTRSSPSYKYPLANFHGKNPDTFKFLSSSHSSTTTTSPPSSYLEDSFRIGRFLSNEELEKLKFLENFRYFKELKSGSLWVRVMRADEIDITVGVLAESVAESMLLPSGFVPALKYLLMQYLVERRTQMPHTATLIGFYTETMEGGEEEEEVQLAGTVEIFFDKRGAHASPPSPTPPKDSPYICNMAVEKSLRRRGIGWHLLKASEELISQMSSSREVYLHCRMIDAAPLNMYKKADYKIVKTDNILVLLMLQRRKHLMCKKLPLLSNPPESDLSDSDMEKST